MSTDKSLNSDSVNKYPNFIFSNNVHLHLTTPLTTLYCCQIDCNRLVKLILENT